MKVEVDDKYLAFLEMEYVKKVFGDDFFIFGDVFFKDFFKKVSAALSEGAAKE